ncbi:unnamed protein product [Pieris macdunnoughi]|nr:unnamed protein product [Pieris macdunnoughi]
MRIIMLILAVVYFADGHEIKKGEIAEARGKGKYALVLHFLYVAATKLFVLKLVYGALFYVIVYKAWHLVLWLLKYIKANKHHHIEYEHIYDHGHVDFGHDPYGAYEKPIYGRKEYSSKVYDSDGSYSVQS